MLIVNDVLKYSRLNYLNDPEGRTYPDSVLIPYVNSARDELQTALENMNAPVKKSVETEKLIRAGDTLYNPLPPDFLNPIELFERQANTEDQYVPMTERAWEPNILPNTSLRYWVFRKNQIFFLGATQDREVKMHYQWMFPLIDDPKDQMQVQEKTRLFLASRAASSAHMFISQNETLSRAARGISDIELKALLQIAAKLQQAMPTRRKPFDGRVY